MAVKGEKAQSANTGTPGSAPVVDNGETKPKRGVPKGTKRGPLDPSKRWAVTKEQREARNLALVQVLKDPGQGVIKTPASVAEVLDKRPEFEGVTVTGNMVRNRLNSIISRRKKKGKEIGAHLILGTVRETDKELEVFD